MSKPLQSANIHRMKMRVLISLCALAFGWGAIVLAQAADQLSEEIGFFESGVICAPLSIGTRDAPDTVAGTTHVIEDAPPFVSNGRVVPAVLGIGFGVRAGMSSTIGQDNVIMQITHPPFSGSGATQQSFITSIGPEDAPGVTFYQFDYGYELAIGEWVMMAIAGETVLYEVTFNVVPPSALPELADVCGYIDLLS